VSYAPGVLANGPVQYLRLGEPSGGTAADSSGSGRTGAYHGPIGYGQLGPIGDSTALWFDGTDGTYVDAGLAGYLFGTGPLSVEAWVQTNGRRQRAAVLRRQQAGRVEPGRVQCRPLQRDPVLPGGRRDTQFFQKSVGTVNDGAWHHVVCVLEAPLRWRAGSSAGLHRRRAR